MLCTPAAAGAGAKPTVKSQNGDSAAASKSSQTYLIATKELRIEAAATAAAQCFLSNCFPEQGGVVGMPVGMQITSCDAQVRLRNLARKLRNPHDSARFHEATHGGASLAALVSDAIALLMLFWV